MRIFIGLITLLLLFTACSSKSEDPFKDRFEQNKSAYKHLQKTEKAQLYDHNVTKAFLTATYLFTSSDMNKEKKDEQFIVGVYLEEDRSNQLGKTYHLTLEGTKPKMIQPLTTNSPYLEGIPFVTEWSSYYLVTFPHISSISFALTFESSDYGKKEMTFSKTAKYVESPKEK